MITNNDRSQLPDVSVLEKLANQYFKANPTEHVSGVEAIQSDAGGYSQNDPLELKGGTENVYSNFHQPSVGGLGASTTNFKNFQAWDLRDASISDGNFSQNGGRIPSSVAGSGASPSAVHHGNNINIDDPQTSFPDENLNKGKHSSVSPAISLKEYLPFESDNNLTSLLASIRLYKPDTQLPFHAPGIDSAAGFYFLEGKSIPSELGSFGTNPTDIQSAQKTFVALGF